MGSLKGNISGTQTLNGGSAINVAVTPNIEVGSVTTLEPNTSVVVELDENSTRMNPIFNFGIPKGEKGEKGDAGSIKFIIVNELPTENIDESAIYMKQVESEETQNTYEEFIYVNGAWESLGSANVNVDLTDYVKNDDYATSSKGGAVKIGQYGVSINNDGYIYSPTYNETQYENATNSTFVSKGTLENVITGKGLVSNTDYATSEKPGLVTAKQEYGLMVASNKHSLVPIVSETEYDYSRKSAWSFISKGTLDNVLNWRFKTLTQAEYDALTTKDEKTYYFIVEE